MNIYEEKKQKTRMQIQSSLLRLMEEKPFESITIGDITAAACINRGTFYLHYADKYELLDQMEQQLFDELGDHVDELQTLYLSTHAQKSEHERVAETLFDFIREHARQLRLFLNDHGRAGFHIRLKESFSARVRENLERHEGFCDSLNVPMDYFLSFVTSAFLGFIEQWIQDGLDKTSEEMTALYIGLIHFIQKRPDIDGERFRA